MATSTTSVPLKFGLTIAVILAVGEHLGAQSFNVDLDSGFGPAESGNGAPSLSFPGAANQTGIWNRVPASGAGSHPIALLDLSGNSTAAHLTATGGIGSAGGSGYTGNTGDYCLLLNDYAVVFSDHNIYRFSGLSPGDYRVVTYAVRAGPPYPYDAYVTVPGSQQGTQVVSGPMPGNQFVLGVTHCFHDISIFGDSFEVDLYGPVFPYAHCNGFQIVAVPELTPMLGCLSGLAFLAFLRRRSM